MNRWLMLVGLVLLLAGVLALVASGLVGETLIVPLLFLVWLARVVVESIPQVAIWVFLLVLAVPLLWRSLVRPRSYRLRATPPATPRAPVATWTELFGRAELDHYGRWQLASRLSQLAFELLANQEQRVAANPWRIFQDEALAMPAEIRDYLQAGARAYPAPSLGRGWLARPQLATSHDPLDLDPEVVLRFLEGRRSSTPLEDGG